MLSILSAVTATIVSKKEGFVNAFFVNNLASSVFLWYDVNRN